MRNKKVLSTTLIAFGIACFAATPAFAHGHHRQAAPADTSCPVCPYDDCVETGRHTHGETYYCGYGHESGYCDGTCENVSYSCYGHGRHHGCHR